MKHKRKINVFFLTLSITLLLLNSSPYAQTTGKIVGNVVDEATGEGLPAANILIEGTLRGTATDLNGDFYIINIPPGSYTIIIQMMGYETTKVENLRISVNRTTNIEVKMKPAIIKGSEVVVQAERISIKKDQTSSIRNVSADEIDVLPVENVGGVIAMQPGVVRGHFRGGRNNEVSYLIDGVQVTEVFKSEGRNVEIEPEAIQDIEVITGTFNAEYGQAMSGVVNIVTKDGGNEFHGSVESYFANYFTRRKDIFIGLRDDEVNRNKDYKFQLGGPILKNKLTFFTNFRYQDNRNYLDGVRRFNVNDFSYFIVDDPDLYYSEYNGDSSHVPMNSAKNLSFMGKISSKLFKDIKLSLLYTINDDEWHEYSHEYKYNPDGRAIAFRNTKMYSLHLNHLLSSKLFYELKLSYMDNYNGWYVFRDPFDSRYVHDAYHSNAGSGFYTGGQQKGHDERTIKNLSTKLDLTWQINKNHSIKFGVKSIHYDLDNHSVQIRNKYADTEEEGEYYFDFEKMKLVFPNYEPVIIDSSVNSDIYRVYPFEYSGYLQDKIEFDELVINVGLRYDYFNSNTVYPSQRRNPANQTRETDPSRMSKIPYPKADPQIQISPRLGLAYQLGGTALLHFSYGHFFQMPPMFALYENQHFLVAPTDYETTMGNAQIKAQKTVQYEIGLWQELMDGMGIEVALFYRDIYDLLSAKIISTFNQIEYGLYSNKDYGNSKGLEIKYDFIRNKIAAYLNYTLQYTRGNADNPTQTFTRAGDSMDPIAKLIPMSWDQRHTFNATVSYTSKNYNVTLTGYYNSGTTYTWSPILENRIADVNLYPNNDWQQSQYNVDLTAYYDFKLTSHIDLRFTLSVYNMFDRLNENWVNENTGRAYTAIIRQDNLLGHRSNFNDYYDRVHNPSMYQAPRLIKAGIGLTF